MRFLPLLLLIGLGALAGASRAQVPTPPRIEIKGQVLHPAGRAVTLTDAYGNEAARTQLDATGRFRLNPKWGDAQKATLTIGAEYTPLWLTAGDALTLTVDARRFDETIRYAGRGAKVNTYRAADLLAAERQQARYQQTLSGTEKAFRQWLRETVRADSLRLRRAFPHATTASERAFVNDRANDRFLLAQQRRRDWATDRLTRPGLPAPGIQALTADGQPWAGLPALRGKVVYVDFWASWCGFCVSQAQAARQLHAALADRCDDVVFLNVSIDKARADWQQAISRYGIEGLNVWSPDSLGAGCAGDTYQLGSLPRYLIVGRDGRVAVSKAPWPMNSQAAEAAIRAVLAGKIAGGPRQ